MKFNKKVQYALLFSLYLSKVVQSSVEEAAMELNIPVDYLSQIALTLKKKGVVTSIRGPGGGYKLKDNPSFYTIFAAFGYIQPLSVQENVNFNDRQSTDAHKSVSILADDIQHMLTSLLDQPVIGFTKESYDCEV